MPGSRYSNLALVGKSRSLPGNSGSITVPDAPMPGKLPPTSTQPRDGIRARHPANVIPYPQNNVVAAFGSNGP